MFINHCLIFTSDFIGSPYICFVLMIKKTKKKEKKTFLKGYQLDVVEKLKGRRTLRSDTIFGY